MFIPSHFKNENLNEVRTFLKANSFGILITTVEKKPWGTHIPLELETDPDGQEVIYGHIAKANPQWQYFNNQTDVLLIFTGPHGYVSSSWYNHENVPTWNYIAVHVYGTLQIIQHGDDELHYALDKLMQKYEAQSEHPIKMSDFSEKTMRQMKGIVGFKIRITEIQAAYKLSQNRNDEDYHNVVQQLTQSKDVNQKALGKSMDGRRE